MPAARLDALNRCSLHPLIHRLMLPCYSVYFTASLFLFQNMLAL